MNMQTSSAPKLAQYLAGYGRNGDTMLAHITPEEAALLKANGGSGTINPETGLPEFFKLRKFLGKVLKVAAPIASFIPGVGPLAAAGLKAGSGLLNAYNAKKDMPGAAPGAGGVGGFINDAAQTGFQAYQFREANNQAKNLEGQAKTALDQQSTQLASGINRANTMADTAMGQQGAVSAETAAQGARLTGLQDALQGRALAAVDNVGSFDPSRRLEANMDAAQGRTAVQYGRAAAADTGAGDMTRMQDIAAQREAERRYAWENMQGNIDEVGGNMKGLYEALGPRTMYGQDQIDQTADRIYQSRVGGLDRALQRTASEGFAAARRNRMGDSTAATDSQFEIARKFGDMYNQLDSQSLLDAQKYVGDLSGLQTTQRGASIDELGRVLSPELNARLQSYKDDQSALMAAQSAANFNSGNAARLDNLALQTDQLDNNDAQLWASLGLQGQQVRQQGANSLLTALAQQGSLANQNNATRANNSNALLNAFSNLNSQNNNLSTSRATNFTNMAEAARGAAGAAQNRMVTSGMQNFGGALNGAAQGLGNGIADLFRNSGFQSSTNPFGQMDTGNYSNIDPYLLPGTI